MLNRGEDLQRTIKVDDVEEGPELVEPELALDCEASEQDPYDKSGESQHPPRGWKVSEG